eukprot:COSAG02_NODE_48456_length_333_cov_1.311966_2_plen_23_part_01
MAWAGTRSHEQSAAVTASSAAAP